MYKQEKIVFEMTEMDKARFWVKARQTEYCWNWTGSTNQDGYGMFSFKNKVRISSHRVSYMLINGSVGDSCVCHICDNPKCINPSHLFLGSHADNMKDKMNKERGRFQGRTSKYYGVGYRNDSGSWRSYVGKKYIGSFKSEIDAANFRETYIIENKIKGKLNFKNQINYE